MVNTRTSSLFFLFSALAISPSSGYFVINDPQLGTQWSNGQDNLATWEKGVLDGIPYFDIEMARLSQDGLTYVASNVPATTSSLNIHLQDVPPGDDYFLVFLNSTAGIMHSTSKRFTILSSSSPTSSSSSTTTPPPLPNPNPNAPTVTISGSPNPTQPFATTFAAVGNVGVSDRRIGGGGVGWGLGGVVVMGVMSGLCAVW
ncbi:hypothetical protein BDN72DRAFT_263867 [Pluteus cervinus]|uniref:Uncharacterized protein n=1 Tax=Pluteus cervinus TaxID=181527 RepID=A0ACD3AFJ3_9AGAR|nr:hypothetical protein BDN72DRAFT_263867 [Pluteus cervinus]